MRDQDLPHCPGSPRFSARLRPGAARLQLWVDLKLRMKYGWRLFPLPAGMTAFPAKDWKYIGAGQILKQ